jgi:hypothetical protein
MVSVTDPYGRIHSILDQDVADMMNGLLRRLVY